METALYILPLLIAILSFTLLFLDPEKRNTLIIGIVIFSIAIGLSVTSAVLVKSTFKEQSTAQFKLAALENWKERQVAKLHSLLAQFRGEAEDNRFRIQYLASLGWHIKNENFMRSLSAEKLREEIIAKLPKNHFSSKSLVIKNLPEDIDQEIIIPALEELGFTVIPTPPTPDANHHEAPTEQNVQDMEMETETKDSNTAEQPNNTPDATLDETIEQTNIRRANFMYYGPYVKNYEIKLIALTLLRAGVQLKHLRLGKQTNNQDARAVIFDWSDAYNAHSTIEPIELYNQQSFRR